MATEDKSTFNYMEAAYNLKFEEVELSFHALKRIQNRKIDLDELVDCIDNPERIRPSMNRKSLFFYRGRNDIHALVDVKTKTMITVYVNNYSYAQAYLKSKNNKRK